MMSSKNALVYGLVALVVMLLVVIGVCSINRYGNSPAHYSLTDLGLPSLNSPDCSKIDNSNTNYPATISFSVADVSGMRDKIKVLSDKYKGQITLDSYTSYPSTPVPSAGNGQNQVNTQSQDNASLTIILANSEQSFMTDLTALIKTAGGINSSYTAQGSQYGSSPLSSCQTYLQSVATDKTQLEILTNALSREHSPQVISYISQAISGVRSTALSDVNSLNDFFKNINNPTVTISISSIQH